MSVIIWVIIGAVFLFALKIYVNKVKEFEKEYLEFLNVSHRDILDQLKAGKLTDEITATLEKVAQDLSEKYAK